MLKIKALNQDTSSDEDVPTIRREAQEEIVLELYNNSLRAQAQKDYEKSSTILKQLLQENIPQLESNGGLPKSMSTLKYSCFVNLGNIYLKQEQTEDALESLTRASELDSTDVTLWSKIGQLAMKENKFNKAAYAFSKGLECSESHWPCLDNLISVLYAIRDTISCLIYIGRALSLDEEYTKGLVLRRQIYKENPATEEYYKLYNPEYIWEPRVDVEIDQEEAEEVLKEAELISSRVTELERALSKGFDTIPLPKALGDYTWLALAQTITHCHQYISDNNLSHFTFLDMSKCMSQSGETTPVSSKIIEDVVVTKDSKLMEIVTRENSSENLEKMDTAPVLERRFSQASEGNDTPSQTDNDEEQNMEVDNDETEGETTDTGRTRKTKRKRDVLSDLQIWGWHSKRKPPKKPRDFTIEDAINRIIPKTLLKNKISNDTLIQNGEDSMNTMDIYNMYVDNKDLNFLSPIHSPGSVNFEQYFGTDREKEDVLKFWTKERARIDIIVLLREVVFELVKLWRYKWPKELVPMYILAFKMYRQHYDQPELFPEDTACENLKNDSLATLVSSELQTFSTETPDCLCPTILGYLQLASSWSYEWQEEFLFPIRFFWLQAHIFRRSDENELATRSLECILQEIDTLEATNGEKFTLNLSNCQKYGFISRQIVEKIAWHLDMITSLANVESMFNARQYEEVADILKHTFQSGVYSKVGKMGRPAQLGILLHSLWYLNCEECFVWSEHCLHEAVQNWGKINTSDKWDKIVDKSVAMLMEIIKKETITVIDKLSEDNRCRLVENLARILCRQLNGDSNPGNVSTWLLLHYVLLREEHRAYANSRLKSKRPPTPDSTEDELPPSTAILFSAHEFLGPKGWCLTSDGQLLHFILDTVLERLDTPIFEPFRDKIEIHIEQALFCLYLYPSKKNKVSRHLVDHNVNPVELTWERSFQLYQYYAPDRLPEFNSYKNQSISSELEQLFKRIIALVPSTTLTNHLPKIQQFVNGQSTTIPDPIDFPGKIRAIYYLLGDYYFKEKEFAGCTKYFQQDICINPMRLDSWASLALSYAAQLDNILNFCEKMKNERDFFEKAKSAQVCFRKALELDPENLMLWIECGSFEYMVHSFCSRLIKYESENFSMEKFELLETEKESYLDSSCNSLEHAIGLYGTADANEPDERWLQYYILGKIAEKKRKEPAEYLQYYMTASSLLSENKASYPDKINYNNPQHLSVEALELHYRIHASVLKYLELHEGKEISNSTGIFFRKCLAASAKRYAAAPVLPKPAQITSPFQPPTINIDMDAQEIVKSCLDEILDKVDRQVQLTTEPVADKNEDNEVSIIENEEVVMVISDSDEEKEEKKEDAQAVLDKMMEQTMKDSDVAEQNTNKKSSSSSSGSSSESSDSSSGSDSDDTSSSSSSSSESTNENLSKAEVSQLVEKCINGLELCITRLPQNYKALYRLAHLYFNYKSCIDYNKCKQLMLSEYKCKNDSAVSGLFAERTTKNFFNGIWRIPSTEIDRPGSLAAHMNRCITLVVQVLRKTNDTKTLLELFMQLRRVPDRDKIYIKDSDRTGFSKQAMDMCVQSFKEQIREIPNMQSPQVAKLLHEILRAYQRAQKHIPNKEAAFSSLLIDAYKQHVKDPIPTNASVLDIAIKFCQQSRILERQRLQQQQLINTRTVMGASPTHPAPSTFLPPKMKSPTMGRPRGRPPLPKASPRPRAKSPMGFNPYNTFNANYEYVKHYQDELVRQYSQNMSLTQLQQITSLFSSGQLSNPAVAQAVITQFISQLTPSSAAGLMGNPLTTTSLFSMSEQMKYLQNMLPKPTASTAKSTVKTSASTSKPKDVLFKEPVKVPEKTVSIMKERPSISITPVGGATTPTTSTPSHVSISKATTGHPVSGLSITKQPISFNKPKAVHVPTITSTFAKKPAYVAPPSTVYPKPQVPTAHTAPPVTPPPTSSPSFPKPNTSPGKTLQEKLADKKKQQETKQLMKSIESDIIYASKLPPVFKNLPNIPASLSVSPAINPLGYQMPLAMDKSFPKARSKGLEIKPATPVLPQIYGPRFSADSGISISQVSKEPTLKKTKPVSKDRSVEISAIAAPNQASVIVEPKKAILSVKTDLFPKSANLEKLKSLSGIEIKAKPLQRQHSENLKSRKKVLSTIRSMSSIDITPIPSTSKKKAQKDEDVICID